jgi:tetratricopeptide (TPR) repeat protein
MIASAQRKPMHPHRPIIPVAALLLTAGQLVVAQGVRVGSSVRACVSAEVLERPLPLRDGIGKAHEEVTSSSSDAQAWYDQGLAYLHSYVWVEAARSFHQALRLDPNLALGYLGLSYALDELGERESARRASQQALALSGNVTEREKIRINLRAAQLAASAGYPKDLDRALSRYSDDVELLLLRGQAEEQAHDAPGMGASEGSVTFYEHALARQPHYFATHHYLTHALENSGQMDRALEHAAEYARLAPAVPHAHHMHGHVLQRVNRVQEAIDEFRHADELALAYFRTGDIAPECDWQYHHNLDLLGSSYEYAGQMRLAEGVLRRSFELPSIQLSQELNEAAWPSFLLWEDRAAPALSAARALIARSEPAVRALGRLVASRVLMRMHRMDDATAEGDQAVQEMRASPIGGVLLPELQLVQGEFLLRNGQAEGGSAALREGVTKLRADPAPDRWMQSLLRLDAVCRLARELDEWTLAAEITREMQKHDPAYPGTHYALARVAEQEGNTTTALDEYAAAVKGWGAGDPDFTSLTDARRRLAALQRSPN